MENNCVRRIDRAVKRMIFVCFCLVAKRVSATYLKVITVRPPVSTLTLQQDRSTSLTSS